MSAKLMLDVAAMQESFFSDAALIGIVSALPGYKFSWLMNRRFDIRLVRDPESDICIKDNQKQEHYFPIYSTAFP